jgi:cytidyltransferase-like protein
MQKKICLAIMRLQPLHEGHKILIRKMFEKCDDVIIAIGSVNKKDHKNPFSYKERKNMLLKAFKDKTNLSIIPLEDIGAQTKKEWIDYVKERLRFFNLKEPCCYYCGSKEDASWYEESNWKIYIVDRFSIGKGINATQIRKNLLKE